jgi:hypothetical protein
MGEPGEPLITFELGAIRFTDCSGLPSIHFDLREDAFHVDDLVRVDAALGLRR